MLKSYLASVLIWVISVFKNLLHGYFKDIN